jgi:hypothetical protein
MTTLETPKKLILLPHDITTTTIDRRPGEQRSEIHVAEPNTVRAIGSQLLQEEVLPELVVVPEGSAAPVAQAVTDLAFSLAAYPERAQPIWWRQGLLEERRYDRFVRGEAATENLYSAEEMERLHDDTASDYRRTSGESLADIEARLATLHNGVITSALYSHTTVAVAAARDILASYVHLLSDRTISTQEALHAVRHGAVATGPDADNLRVHFMPAPAQKVHYKPYEEASNS